MRSPSSMSEFERISRTAHEQVDFVRATIRICLMRAYSLGLEFSCSP